MVTAVFPVVTAISASPAPIPAASTRSLAQQCTHLLRREVAGFGVVHELLEDLDEPGGFFGMGEMADALHDPQPAVRYGLVDLVGMDERE